MKSRRSFARVAAIGAVVLGLGHAAVSAYWAAGGSALLDTIGGDIERWGRERQFSVVVALWGIVALKTIVALAAPVVVFRPGFLPPWTARRVPRILSWIAATILVIYGGLLTGVGLLVQSGLIEANSDADQRALVWHTYLWDPWFLLWGSAFVVCLGLRRPPPSRLGTGPQGQRRGCWTNLRLMVPFVFALLTLVTGVPLVVFPVIVPRRLLGLADRPDSGDDRSDRWERPV